MIVTVTWMDGQEETYQCDDRNGWKVIDGVLWLRRFGLTTCIPYDVNIRTWKMLPDHDEQTPPRTL